MTSLHVSALTTLHVCLTVIVLYIHAFYILNIADILYLYRLHCFILDVSMCEVLGLMACATLG